MIIRFFLSAVSPNDVDEVIRLFQEDVIPAFEAHPECLAIELVVGERPNVGGLVEGGALSRWTSVEAMEEALDSSEIQQSQLRVRQFLRREPVRKTYRVAT